MAKNKTPIYEWYEEDGIAACYITGSLRGREKKYYGAAYVHPDDADMKSELIGSQLAEWRAQIQLIQDYLANELEPGLAALKQLYYSMKHSKKFNPKSYEAKMLFRQIRLKEDDITFCKQTIGIIKLNIKEYIDVKEKNYQLIRKKRKNK